MQQKAFTLHNKGMNRDLSISKAGESSAYENHNIRITARDKDTLLSVTNERGNREVELGALIQGELIGWNVLNKHVILFTTDNGVDRIYRIDYVPEDGTVGRVPFKITYGGEEGTVDGHPLYEGDLGFSLANPIESIVYHETENIQKIYWVDGKHPLRFMNFVADEDEIAVWNTSTDNTWFDSNRPIMFTVSAEIEKNNAGNNRANGTVQYMLTYFNKHGQETGIAWVSDLVYLSPSDVGGSADGTNNNKVTITFSNLDTRFTNFRVYSVFRSSLNGTPVAYIVGEGATGSESIIVDDGAHLTTEDVSRLLYLGSHDLVAGTMTHKDQTLFLGDLMSTGQDYSDIKDATDEMYDSTTGLIDSSYLEFVYDDSIPYNDVDGSYSYSSELIYSSSEILSFKGGEKYRFALSFTTKAGIQTRAFWIGDAVNPLYPIIDVNNNVIKRIVAKCTIPQSIIDLMEEYELSTVRLMIAEATYADRAIKAQGIVNPTMFNIWERYNSRLYSMPSWISRPRRSGFACSHYDPVNNSIYSSGEIQCNYWEKDNPRPYYQVDNGELVDELDGIAAYNYVFIAYGYQRIKEKGGNNNNICRFQIVLLTCDGSEPDPSVDMTSEINNKIFQAYPETITNLSWNNISSITSWTYKGNYKDAYRLITEFLNTHGVTNPQLMPLESDIMSWFGVQNNNLHWRVQGDSANDESTFLSAYNEHTTWNAASGDTVTDSFAYNTALYRRHLMFVDENVVTLNSPEFDYEAVYIDNQENTNGYKFRLVGVAKITGSYSDYVVDSSPGKISGESLVSASFDATIDGGNLDGLTSWPLWKELGLRRKDPDNPNDTQPEIDVKDRTSDYYTYNSDIDKYWLHMWNHSGKIDAYTDDEAKDYSSLHSKTFATMRFSNCTMYKNLANITNVFSPESVRMFNSTSSQYTGIDVNGQTKYYDGCPNTSLALPGVFKYPIGFSHGTIDTSDQISFNPDNVHLFISDPVQINYLSNPHAVISLPTQIFGSYYNQRVLPYLDINGSRYDITNSVTGATLPWVSDKEYGIVQDPFYATFNDNSLSLTSEDRYLFIGELYYDYDNPSIEDTRYGGISESAIESCRFITAGPSYNLAQLDVNSDIYANQGDTYIQRWDCLKTKPVGASNTNNVIDVTSVMIESHINLDGRTDKLRGTRYLASIDAEKYGALNPVYSQQNNYTTRRVLDDDTNLDTYNSSITWTLDKHDSADIDEWTHITLANSLKLDGDKGDCRALRRFNNSIIAFQDKAISEILFNSRTQIPTSEGVPIEIANSGKVDGKRYITNKYGCLNKWSIVEGKAALYFVDNINKAFCSFGSQGIRDISTELGFGAWFRENNSMQPWNAELFYANNLKSFYDRIHSDVYLVRGWNGPTDPYPCLVYSETLNAFTSFYDYLSVPMMVNVEDEFISFRDNKLWLQNKGLYCRFFGEDFGYNMTYRVTPDPFGDKIWTNIDYRADFYKLTKTNGDDFVKEADMINGDFDVLVQGHYQPEKTFDELKIWNEYQNTGSITLGRNYTTDKTTRRKFRIWHIAIPRSQKSDKNKWGLDRIRNPWINFKFSKWKNESDEDGRDMMQLHDITVRYFE